MLIEVASPEGLAFSAPATSITLQTADGEIEVLPGHTDLVTLLVPGELVLRDTAHDEKVFALGDGFVLIGANKVTILANFAEADALINEEEVERAQLRAQNALANAGAITDAEREELESTITRTMIELQVKNRKKARERSPGQG